MQWEGIMAEGISCEPASAASIAGVVKSTNIIAQSMPPVAIPPAMPEVMKALDF